MGEIRPKTCKGVGITWLAHRPRLKGKVLARRVEDGTPHRGGVIDFGDAVHSWRVNDVAIAMAYVMVCICNPENKRSGFAGDAAESLLAAAHFLHGFETCARPCTLLISSLSSFPTF